MEPFTIMAIAAGASALINGIGAISSANQEADAERRKADLERKQAARVIEAAKRNARVTLFQRQKQVGQLRVARAASGLKSGTLVEDAEIASTILEEQEAIMNEARWQAHHIREGASLRDWSAGNIETAGKWEAAGSLLGGGRDVASIFAKYGG